jgi:hypothetical protein
LPPLLPTCHSSQLQILLYLFPFPPKRISLACSSDHEPNTWLIMINLVLAGYLCIFILIVDILSDSWFCLIYDL